MGEPFQREDAIRYYDRVYRMAYVLCGNETDALDLTQETMAQAIRSADRFRGGSSVYTWLVAILKNVRSHSLRRRPHEVMALHEPPPPGEQGARVRRAILELPEDHREAVVMYFDEGMSYAEIADAAGVPVGTVRSRLHAAKERLRKVLHDVR